MPFPTNADAPSSNRRVRDPDQTGRFGRSRGHAGQTTEMFGGYALLIPNLDFEAGRDPGFGCGLGEGPGGELPSRFVSPPPRS